MTTLSEANTHLAYKSGNQKHANRRSCRSPMRFSVFLSTAKLSIFIALLIFFTNYADAFVISPAFTLRSSTWCGKVPSEVILSAEGRSATEPKEATSSSPTSDVTYRLRDCQYRELNDVATLVVESFYDKKKVNLVARKLYRLAEMNRLQQNFPYPESRGVHRMLVIEASQEGNDEPTIVGFCDVDSRPCATKLKLPRPYLSDLAVDPKHRRKGLARMLVEASEEFVQNDQDGSPSEELWIRVASDNEAALGLYRDKLGYSFADWSTGEETTGDGAEIFTLRKDFRKE